MHWNNEDIEGNRGTKAPPPREMLSKSVIEARRNAVIVSRNGPAIELARPLTIRAEEALDTMDGFERAIAAVAA